MSVPHSSPEIEKYALLKKGLMIAFIIIGIGAIVAMFIMDPDEKPLVCQGHTSLTHMGGCVVAEK